MKKIAFLLLFILCGLQVYSQHYESARVQRRLDSTCRYFDVTNKKISGFQLAMRAGVFAPQGNLSILGPHFYLGGSVGWRFNKFMFDLTMDFRMDNAPNYYTVSFQDTLHQTSTYHNGGCWGLNTEYQLYKNKKHEVDLLAGVGYDAFVSAFNTRDTVIFESFNFNIGFGYKIFLRHFKKATYQVQYISRHSKRPSMMEIDCAERYSYLAFQVKYNLLNYTNPGGTDLSGNAFTVGIVYGFYRYPKYHLFAPKYRNNGT